MSYHSHRHRDEVWTVISGEGEATVDGNSFAVREGDVIKLPSGTKHTVRAKTALKIIEVQMGREISVGDKLKVQILEET